jgi:hypothetical protein
MYCVNKDNKNTATFSFPTGRNYNADYSGLHLNYLPHRCNLVASQIN